MTFLSYFLDNAIITVQMTRSAYSVLDCYFCILAPSTSVYIIHYAVTSLHCVS